MSDYLQNFHSIQSKLLSILEKLNVRIQDNDAVSISYGRGFATATDFFSQTDEAKVLKSVYIV